jgi:hypothetical protein
MTDKVFAQELYLFITNDGLLYRQMGQSIIKNYAIKKVKGEYDAELAIKGWLNMVEAGLRKYKTKFPGYYKVDKETKIFIARGLGKHYEEEILLMVKKLTVLKKAGKAWQRV